MQITVWHLAVAVVLCVPAAALGNLAGRAIWNWRQVRELPFTREDVRYLRRYLEMACCCGVITLQDYKDWDEALKRIPPLLSRLEDLLTHAGA